MTNQNKTEWLEHWKVNRQDIRFLRNEIKEIRKRQLEIAEMLTKIAKVLRYPDE